MKEQVQESDTPQCRSCGKRFPHLPAAWHQRALERPERFQCAPCSLMPRCHAPEVCPTADLCRDMEECAWPR